MVDKQYVLRNVKTGEEHEIDPWWSRYNRMCRRVVTWARVVEPVVKKMKYRKVMIVLTYARVGDWKPNHIRDFRRRYKEKLGDGLVAYAWVAEVQERGAIHYHFMLVVKRGTDVPFPDKNEYWKWGSTKIINADSVYYMVTYLGKEYQKDFCRFPKGARCFAVWLSKDYFSEQERWGLRMSALPKWLEDIMRSIEDWEGLCPKRLEGVGWVLKVPLHVRRGKPYKKYEVFESDWVVD